MNLHLWVAVTAAAAAASSGQGPRPPTDHPVADSGDPRLHYARQLPFIRYSCPRPFRYLSTCRSSTDCRTGCCAKFSLRPIREWSAECCVPRPLVRVVDARGWCLKENDPAYNDDTNSNNIAVDCPKGAEVSDCSANASCIDNMSCSPEEICCPNACSGNSCISSFNATRIALKTLP